MCKTIKQKVKFAASPGEVYRLLVDSKSHAAFSGKPARIDARPGGRFSSYDGAISGIVVDLESGRRVVQAWRERHWGKMKKYFGARLISGR